MKILIIEDDDQLSKLLTNLLILNEYNIRSVKSAEEGWGVFSKSPSSYDVILTDINLPGMNGIGLIERIRKEGYNIPVIVMTGYSCLDLSISALKLGAYDFIIKPFNIKVLLSSLEKLTVLQEASQEAIETHPYTSDKLQISVPTKIEHITSVISTLQSFFNAACKLYEIDATKISLCLQEALINAFIHGNLGVPSSLKEESWELFDEKVKEREAIPDYADKKVFIRYFMDKDFFYFEIEDQGDGFDPFNLPDLEDQLAMMCSGRGLLIIKSYMDEVTWNEKGNCVKMVKYLQ